LHADDLKLARSLVTGDEKMFNQFFEQFFPRLYRFAFSRLSDESIVEDVVQSTLMNAMRGMKNYRGGSIPFNWSPTAGITTTLF
jgi:RNA polymerase sigma-70 factor (ECF subfamily)